MSYERNKKKASERVIEILTDSDQSHGKGCGGGESAGQTGPSSSTQAGGKMNQSNGAGATSRTKRTPPNISKRSFLRHTMRRVMQDCEDLKDAKGLLMQTLAEVDEEINLLVKMEALSERAVAFQWGVDLKKMDNVFEEADKASKSLEEAAGGFSKAADLNGLKKKQTAQPVGVYLSSSSSDDSDAELEDTLVNSLHSKLEEIVRSSGNLERSEMAPATSTVMKPAKLEEQKKKKSSSQGKSSEQKKKLPEFTVD